MEPLKKDAVDCQLITSQVTLAPSPNDMYVCVHTCACAHMSVCLRIYEVFLSDVFTVRMAQIEHTCHF